MVGQSTNVVKSWIHVGKALVRDLEMVLRSAICFFLSVTVLQQSDSSDTCTRKEKSGLQCSNRPEQQKHLPDSEGKLGVHSVTCRSGNFTVQCKRTLNCK